MRRKCLKYIHILVVDFYRWIFTRFLRSFQIFIDFLRFEGLVLLNRQNLFPDIFIRKSIEVELIVTIPHSTQWPPAKQRMLNCRVYERSILEKDLNLRGWSDKHLVYKRKTNNINERTKSTGGVQKES